MPDLASCAERYMLAVKRLGEESGYNRLSYFEAPISRMPTEAMRCDAQARWIELNDAGVVLAEAVRDARAVVGGPNGPR